MFSRVEIFRFSLKHIKNSTREWEQEHSKSGKSVNMDDLWYPYIQESK